MKSATRHLSQAARKGPALNAPPTPRQWAAALTEAREGDVVELSVSLCICSAFIVAISPMDTPRCREAGKHNPVKCLEETWTHWRAEPRLPFFVSLTGGGAGGGGVLKRDVRVSVLGTFKAQSLNSTRGSSEPEP